jgi:hypothetical protein
MVETIIADNPMLRSHFLSISDKDSLQAVVNEYIIRLDTFYWDTPKLQVLFLVGKVPEIFRPEFLNNIYSIHGREIDGDLVVSWPENADWLEKQNYAPFKDRESMLIKQQLDLSKFIEENPQDRILMNPGTDFMRMFPDMISAVVTIPLGLIERNISSRKLKAEKEETEGSEKTVFPAQSTDVANCLKEQEAMEVMAKELKIPILDGFDDPSVPSLKGLIVATSGAGKSTFVRKRDREVGEQLSDLQHHDVGAIFMDAVFERMKELFPDMIDDIISGKLTIPEAFRVSLVSSFRNENEEKEDLGPPCELASNRDSTRTVPLYALKEGFMFLDTIDWTTLLEQANDVQFNEGRSEKTFSELQKKAGACGVIQCPDESLVPYSSVLKEIDPLRVQIGKDVNKLVAYDDGLRMTQRESGIHSPGWHQGDDGQYPSQEYLEQKYPTKFCQMYMYAMMGSGPWDTKKSVWNGVVPHMINVSSGTFNGLIWSTSPFGGLYSTSPVISVVPLFPQLIEKFFSNGKPDKCCALVTELDVMLGYTFRAKGGALRSYEWVFDVSKRFFAGSGHAIVVSKRNSKIYDVELKGEKYYSTHDKTPHATFESEVNLDIGTVLPIIKIEKRDGSRFAIVQVTVGDKQVSGHITLGLPPLFASCSEFSTRIDNPMAFETSEMLQGKKVFLMRREDIPGNSLVFRCGERVNEGIPIYFAMVNKSLMGTGKLQRRMSINDIVTKAKLRIKEGIDRSGHVALAANLPPLHQCVFMASVIVNMANFYDARGIYKWEGLPHGKWHTVDDYLSAVDFGLDESRKSQSRDSSLRTFKEFFTSVGQFDFSSVDSYPYYLSCCHNILNAMFS